jgi:hypothetical protein
VFFGLFGGNRKRTGELIAAANSGDTGDTAIGNAVRRGNLGIVKLLLARGTKTREALPRDQRLVDLATERGRTELPKLLAAHA